MKLCAVLLNPPTPTSTRAGERTVSEVCLAAACQVLGVESLLIENLSTVPTKDLPSLNELARQGDVWSAARPRLEAALSKADAALLAYGLGGFTGCGRLGFAEQVEWLRDSCSRSGHTEVWMVGGAPRHPSRWRQYLGPQRGLYTAASLESRLLGALTRVRLVDDFAPRGADRRNG